MPPRYMMMPLYLGDKRCFVLIVREKYHQEKLLMEPNISVQLTMATGFTVELLISFPPPAKKKKPTLHTCLEKAFT